MRGAGLRRRKTFASMAKPKPTPPPASAPAPAPEAPAPAKADPLASKAGKAEIAALFHAACDDVRLGPGGMGWRNNESKRAAVSERAEFLGALLTLLP